MAKLYSARSKTIPPLPWQTFALPFSTRGIYGLFDHMGSFRYIGSTSSAAETFYKRIHQHHRTGSESSSHYFSRMYNTGRMWRLRNDPPEPSRNFCAVAAPLSVNARIHLPAMIEPMIGHMKNDGRLTRSTLKGTEGDALFAVLCGCGHNIRMILRKVLCRLIWLFTRLRQINNAEMEADGPYRIVRMPA